MISNSKMRTTFVKLPLHLPNMSSVRSLSLEKHFNFWVVNVRQLYIQNLIFSDEAQQRRTGVPKAWHIYLTLQPGNLLLAGIARYFVRHSRHGRAYNCDINPTKTGYSISHLLLCIFPKITEILKTARSCSMSSTYQKLSRILFIDFYKTVLVNVFMFLFPALVIQMFWNLRQKMLRVRKCYFDNMTKRLVHVPWSMDFGFWWHWHVHWHTWLWDTKLKVLGRLIAIAGNPCFAVCTKCSQKRTHCFANVTNDVRNSPKQPRKTVRCIHKTLLFF